MLVHKKREFPYCAPMSLEPDMELIKSSMDSLADQWQDNFAAHPGICMTNGYVAEETYQKIDHIALTGPSKHDGALTGQAYRMEDIPDASEDRRKLCETETPKLSAKDKLRGRAGHLLNEHNWGEPREFYKDTKLHKHITELFKAPVIRIRYSAMVPGATISPHIDYNTTYAVRFIIPIDGNEGVDNVFYDKGEEHVYNLEHGKCYFLNIGYKHAVYHRGDKVRRYLIGSLGGQQDILDLVLDK